MTHFRDGDLVLVDDDGTIMVVGKVGPSEEVHVADGFAARVVHADGLTLLCPCTEPAAWFDWAGDPFCEACAPKVRIPVRPDPRALLHCGCGDALDTAHVEGIWTMGDVACEYRTCLHCRSTKAWMPRPVVAGRKVHLYEDPESSEIIREWDDLHEALEYSPSRETAQLIRNGVVLADAVSSPLGGMRWKIRPPEREDPLTDAIRVINPSEPPKQENRHERIDRHEHDPEGPEKGRAAQG